MKLTPTQLKHYETVMWFLSNARGEGKSSLVAYCLLSRACQQPGIKYCVNDFPVGNYANGTRDKQYLMHKIADIAKDEGVRIRINIANMEFWVEGSNPFILGKTND